MIYSDWSSCFVKFMKHTFPILIVSFELAVRGKTMSDLFSLKLGLACHKQQSHSTTRGLFSLKLGLGHNCGNWSFFALVCLCKSISSGIQYVKLRSKIG